MAAEFKFTLNRQGAMVLKGLGKGTGKIFTTSGYGGFIEIETKKRPATPYFRPGLHATEAGLPGKFKGQIKTFSMGKLVLFAHKQISKAALVAEAPGPTKVEGHPTYRAVRHGGFGNIGTLDYEVSG